MELTTADFSRRERASEDESHLVSILEVTHVKIDSDQGIVKGYR
jgi:hypothetical protein